MTSLATHNTQNRSTFLDINKGDTLTVATYGSDNVLVRFDRGPEGQSDLAGVIVSADQAPAVALAILTAAGFVPRGNRRDSDSIQESVDTAAGYLDDAVLIAAGTAAKKELTRRRDELAAKLFDLPVYELHPGPFDYADSTEVVRNAIDMIIQLQDEASK